MKLKRTVAGSGPVALTALAATALRPVAEADITAGFWAARRAVNSEVCVPAGPALLESGGNLHNLHLAAGLAGGEYRGDLPFLDSDVYKWLEAAAWVAAQSELPAQLLAARQGLVAAVRAAQRDDGYLNSFFQVVKDGERWTDLRWGHELYCAGHLIQAGIAGHRATGDAELLDVAVKFADCVEAVFGTDKKIDGVCGHAEIETALVELYRETGQVRYLDLAAYFVERRGHGLLNPQATRGTGPGPVYCQDHVPVRQATAVAGHAVRQLYFLTGVADVAAETGDAGLRVAAERLWAEMTARKTHITGGLGAHHAEEDFGDPFELPNERAYCETCAAIASVQFSWRMALLTGQAKYSDLVERTLFNAVLPGVSLDGTGWLYANPLQVRDEHVDRHGDHGVKRTGWFRCACCPPNLMRLLASLPHYFASCDDDGLQLHQYATGTYGGAVQVETGYPFSGGIGITVQREGNWTLSLRIPAWCQDFSLAINAAAVQLPAADGWLRIARTWHVGDTVSLTLAMPVRLSCADPRVDAVRGAVAIERGPLVYCVEETDQPVPGLDAFVLDASSELLAAHEPELLGGVTVVRGVSRRRLVEPAGWWPYRSAGAGAGAAGAAGADAAGTGTGAEDLTEPVPFLAVPYYAWANRQDGAMRIWLPMA